MKALVWITSTVILLGVISLAGLSAQHAGGGNAVPTGAAARVELAALPPNSALPATSATDSNALLISPDADAGRPGDQATLPKFVSDAAAKE
jgi:hypothetical protein